MVDFEQLLQRSTLVQGDTIETMQSLDASTFDLVIADPPYNLGKDFGIGDIYKDIDTWKQWTEQWLGEAVRLLRPGGNILVHGIHNYACYVQVMLFELGLTYRRQIIWHYENGFTQFRNAPAAHYEPIIWFSKGPQSVYNPIYEPYASSERLKYPITKNGKVWTPNPKGRRAGDVWRIPVLAGKRFAAEKVAHPTQKPLRLAQRIVKHFSEENERILVPFAGSGSECVASVVEGRTFLGIELNPEYIKIAESRLANLPQPKLV